MSSAEKAFGLVKTIFTFQEKLDAMNRDLAALGDKLGRLAESHAMLRDRVAQIEGYLKGATGSPFAALPRSSEQ